MSAAGFWALVGTVAWVTLFFFAAAVTYEMPEHERPKGLKALFIFFGIPTIIVFSVLGVAVGIYKIIGAI